MIDLAPIQSRIKQLQERAQRMQLDAKPWEQMYLAALAMDASMMMHGPEPRPEGGLMGWPADLPKSEHEVERLEQLLRPLDPEERFLLKRHWIIVVKNKGRKQELKQINHLLDCYDQWRHGIYCFMNERPDLESTI